MRKKIIGPLTLLLLTGGALAQQLPMKVKGGHLLGETAEQFFAEGREKDLLGECAAGDFKSVNADDKRLGKKYCTELADARKDALSGKRGEYQTQGDPSEMRMDTFAFAGDHLVKVELVYSVPSAESNYSGKTFAEIFAGVKQAYGPPTSETVTPVQDAYGVKSTAHRELWVSPDAAILITEQHAPSGSTTLVAFTRAEYDRTIAAAAPKAANPLE